MTLSQKIEVCKKTRNYASEALCKTLNQVLSVQKLSETTFRDIWLEELRKNNSIFSDGWYMPPPHGIGVLFGGVKKSSRHNYLTLRNKEMWPKSDIVLDKNNGMAYLFASPVDRQTGIIGDFGLTVYFGEDRTIIEHIKLCLSLVKEIFDFIQVGMKFSEVNTFAEKTLSSHGYINEVTSSTDPVGRDYGHTIPGIPSDWSAEESLKFENAESDWDAFKDMVSHKRVFVNSLEETTYQPGMAVTLEPRITSTDDKYLPMVSFHTIIVINEDGTKELLSDFDRIFGLVGMDYML